MNLRLAEDITVRCEDCGRLQARRSAPDETIAFSLTCYYCETLSPDPTRTDAIALVPAAVGRSSDDDEWRIRSLAPDEVERARETDSWIATARCLVCSRSQQGYEEQFDGTSETRLPTHCEDCNGATEVVALEPVIVSQSFDGDEWYVVVLEEYEIEQARLGLDLLGGSWPS